MPAAERKGETSPRAYWLRVLNRIARPVLVASAARELRDRMPGYFVDGQEHRMRHAHLEAVARLLCGIAPCWNLKDILRPERRADYGTS